MADGKLAPLTFTIKYFFTVISKKLRREKGKYQLIKLVCDNPIWLQKFQRELPHVKVSRGFKEGNEICILE